MSSTSELRLQLQHNRFIQFFQILLGFLLIVLAQLFFSQQPALDKVTGSVLIVVIAVLSIILFNQKLIDIENSVGR
ncbi:hypothetical protein HY993_02575 [Candidatus Micrarchaeota archaeon]|nr:hypothetical protein [Candidatus Micrarchaeota archaeon]